MRTCDGPRCVSQVPRRREPTRRGIGTAPCAIGVFQPTISSRSTLSRMCARSALPWHRRRRPGRPALHLGRSALTPSMTHPLMPSHRSSPWRKDCRLLTRSRPSFLWLLANLCSSARPSRRLPRQLKRTASSRSHRHYYTTSVSTQFRRCYTHSPTCYDTHFIFF